MIVSTFENDFVTTTRIQWFRRVEETLLVLFKLRKSGSRWVEGGQRSRQRSEEGLDMVVAGWFSWSFVPVNAWSVHRMTCKVYVHMQVSARYVLVRRMCVWVRVRVCFACVWVRDNPKSGPPTPKKVEVKPQFRKNLGFQ